jgi:membrane protease YdiL (CAAX protease family)
LTTATTSAARSSFTLRFAIALVAGLAAAVVLSPFAAAAVAAMGFHFPFPRIFDRTVMVTLLGALLIWSRSMGFAALMREGFAAPRANLPRVLIGLAISLGAIAILFGLAYASGAGAAVSISALVARALKFALPAIAIGIIEEGFFRAFLLGGMRRDFGPRIAVVASSALYSIVHLVRSPARYYLAGLHPGAGLHNLVASAAQLGHPIVAAPTLVGLFLLGMVLGEAFIDTGTVWFSIGLHAGFVLGAKTWPLIARGGAPISRWVAGPGPVPLIAAPAAWAIALVLLIALPRFFHHGNRTNRRDQDRLGG